MIIYAIFERGSGFSMKLFEMYAAMTDAICEMEFFAALLTDLNKLPVERVCINLEAAKQAYAKLNDDLAGLQKIVADNFNAFAKNQENDVLSDVNEQFHHLRKRIQDFLKI